VHIFAARETVKDLDEMAKGMARADNKRAASAYFIDEESAARAGLEKAVAEFSDRQAAPIAATSENVNASRTADPLMTSGAAPEATTARPLDESDELTNAVAGVATGIGRALDAVGETVGKGIERIADLFGGGSAAPTPTQAPKTPEPKQEPKRMDKPRTMQEYLAREQEQRQATRQELARSIGQSVDTPKSEEELKRDEMERQQRSRDGGISR
jgi:hypothetical protein